MSVMGTCPTCGDETADSCCTACMAERIRKLEAHLATAMDALQFAEGAIIDAVAHEDGLDGAAGYAVLQIIWTELKKHGCTVAATNAIVSEVRGRCSDDEQAASEAAEANERKSDACNRETA